MTSMLLRKISALSAGTTVVPAAHDSATALPSGVQVRRGGRPISQGGQLRTVLALRSGAAEKTQNTLSNQRHSGRSDGVYRSGKDALVEPITIS